MTMLVPVENKELSAGERQSLFFDAVRESLRDQNGPHRLDEYTPNYWSVITTTTRKQGLFGQFLQFLYKLAIGQRQPIARWVEAEEFDNPPTHATG